MRMKKLLLKLLMALCVFAPVVASAANVSLDMTAASAYQWRGQTLNDEAVVQPSLTMSTDYGLSFNTWGSFNLTDRLGSESQKEFTEVDLGVSYRLPIKALDLTVGVTDYEFPHTVVVSEDQEGRIQAAGSYPGTREASVTIGKEDFLLAPSASVYYDFDEANGFYGVVAIGPSLDLIQDKLSAGLVLSLGAGSEDYNEYYFGKDAAALNDGTVKANLSYTISKSLSVSGYVQFTKLLDASIENAARQIYFNDGEMWVGGVTGSYSF
jgi:hypothetical protein